MRFAPFSKYIERFARQYRHSTRVSPDVALLKLRSPYVGSYSDGKTQYTYSYTYSYTFTYIYT